MTIIPLTPHYSKPTRALSDPLPESPAIQVIIQHLNLAPHIEGGYFSETDRDTRRIHQTTSGEYGHSPSTAPTTTKSKETPTHRSLSTNIFYLLTPLSPLGAFHRNKSRTIHTLHRGRGVYVVLMDRANGDGGVEIETFVVGQDVARGEKLQWIVEGGDYKATFLIPDRESMEGGTVIPGFEYDDHDFLKREALVRMVTEKEFLQLQWLLRENYMQENDSP
ncbi:hypothetical protein BO71DRAFT_483902 [Aspergillus ellipticus CBS 707.79]|uniref:DUF985 domain-containing protein n=1 Tax=Aspergillus ellipticus CBS 707.79 TaxID=1448320 RepID=A0A319DJN9_9EURO|nr:hypothetical protein BO71DRAFT_483902 [Aspergillus ellipticus CBS 707.79]